MNDKPILLRVPCGIPPTTQKQVDKGNLLLQFHGDMLTKSTEIMMNGIQTDARYRAVLTSLVQSHISGIAAMLCALGYDDPTEPLNELLMELTSVRETN